VEWVPVLHPGIVAQCFDELFKPSHGVPIPYLRRWALWQKIKQVFVFVGAARGIRTPDPIITNEVGFI
jgi:hypothetical protein